MRSVPVGLVLLDDERPHVHARNADYNLETLRNWADAIGKKLQARLGGGAELVVASETVKSVRVAQRVGEELRRAGCRSVILCFNVWNFPYLVWPLLQTLGPEMPVLSLSGNNGRYPGNVGLLATDGALRQANVRTHRLVGDIGDSEVLAAVADWVSAAVAASAIRGQVYGLYGGHSMGMETGYFHLLPTIKTFGSTVSQVDQLWVVERMKDVDAGEVRHGREWFEGLLGDRLLYDSRHLTPELLETQIRLYLAVRQLNDENGFDYCGIKGQRELSEYICVPDVAEMLLNDPYDWNGRKEPTVCATEADAFAALTMQLMKYVSGGEPSLFMDVRLYHPELDIWDLCNSGQHASWFAARSDDPRVNFERITFHPSLPFYFRAGGASVEFNAGPGELTFARLGMTNDCMQLYIAKGESIELPSVQAYAVNSMTDPTWPHVHARLDCSFPELIDVFPANHVHAIAGDRVRSLTYLAEIAGVEPVILGGLRQRRASHEAPQISVVADGDGSATQWSEDVHSRT